MTGREEFTIATKRTKASIYRDLAEERENEVVYEPRRGQTLLSGCLASVRYVVMLFAVSIMLSALLLSFANDLFAFVKDEDKQINLTVSASDDVDDIAKKLKDGGIIQYRFLFRLFMRITENDEEIVPGDYEIKATMDYRAISKAIGPKVKPRES
ncbi:MAG: endolytic transglycosylase MltG, partial [Clostridia bacterium]|nr:endolytic transglycosylase MltG [Clostridia bacterium]